MSQIWADPPEAIELKVPEDQKEKRKKKKKKDKSKTKTKTKKKTKESKEGASFIHFVLL